MSSKRITILQWTATVLVLHLQLHQVLDNKHRSISVWSMYNKLIYWSHRSRHWYWSSVDSYLDFSNCGYLISLHVTGLLWLCLAAAVSSSLLVYCVQKLQKDHRVLTKIQFHQKIVRHSSWRTTVDCRQIVSSHQPDAILQARRTSRHDNTA